MKRQVESYIVVIIIMIVKVWKMENRPLLAGMKRNWEWDKLE